MSVRSFTPVVFLLLAVSPVTADTLPSVVVTATRTAQTADELLTPVTVITREDIERSQASSVQALLRSMPGITVVNNGGAGKATSIFLRGTESDHLLVLVDGVKIGSATLGTAALQHIPVDSIERIEVVRGPRSSLYGSEAIGGVVQIFTRRGRGPLQPHARFTIGSYDTRKGSLGVSARDASAWFDLTVETEKTDGFNACTGKPFPNGAGCFTVEPDKDGYEREAGSFRAGYRLGKATTIELHGLMSRADTQYDGGLANAGEPFQRVVGAKLQYDPNDQWHIAAGVGSSTDVSKNFKDDTFVSRFQTDRKTASLQADWFPADDHAVTFGADYQTDEVSGTTQYSVSERDDTGVFVQYQGVLGGHDLELRLRRDDNEQFGIQTTGGMAVGKNIGENLRLIASYGTAFKAPTFNELYYPGFGNDQLDPETSSSVELGLTGASQHGTWAVTLYQTEIDDLISYDAATFAPANIEAARIRGMEIELKNRVYASDVSTVLTLLDPQNRGTGPNRGNTLPRRAEQSFRLDLDHDIGKWRVGATLIAVGKRYDDLANTRKLDSYTTLDLRAEYPLSSSWLLQLKAENVLDEKYETAAYYNQAGASAYLTVRYQP